MVRAVFLFFERDGIAKMSGLAEVSAEQIEVSSDCHAIDDVLPICEAQDMIDLNRLPIRPNRGKCFVKFILLRL